MGRAALGAAAKTKTGGVRVTEAQYQWFAAKYGSLGKFLQMKVDEELRAAAAPVSPRQEMK